jgi:glycosyltransferase involved in cell wall biosynthesis
MPDAVFGSSRPKLLVDFAVTKETEGLQQFVLDLVALGYPVRCALWPETQQQRVWPQVADLAAPPSPGDEREEVGVRLSHADSFGTLPTPRKVGLALLEEPGPRSLAWQFAQVDGLLTVSRSGALRLREAGVQVAIQPLSVEGLEQLLLGDGRSALPGGLTADAAAELQHLAVGTSSASLLLLADGGEDASSARLAAVRAARARVSDRAICVAICLSLHSGPPLGGEGWVVLGRHHLLPEYRYLVPTSELANEDLLLGVQDVVDVLGAVPGRSAEAFGLLRFEQKLRAMLGNRGFTLEVRPRVPVDRSRPARRVGIVGPFNVACGVAEETRLLTTASVRPITVFSEHVQASDLVSADDLAIRCYLRSGESYSGLLAEVVQRGIDVVHVQYNHGLFAPERLVSLVLQWRAIGLRTVFTLHAVTEDVLPVAEAFDEVIVTTSTARKHLVELGADPDRVRVVPLPARPLEHASQEAAQKATGISGRPVVATCGFALPHKGLIELMLAVAHLRETHPDVQLALCTPEYPHSRASADYLNECRTVAAEWDLADRVRFAGTFLPMEEVSLWLQAADVIAFPYSHSADQAASGAVRMALGAGRPIIVSDIEVFADLGDTVHRVPAGHVPALARSLERLADDDHLRTRSAGDAARLAARWSPARTVRRHWCEVYHALGDVTVHLEGALDGSDAFAHVLQCAARAFRRLGCDTSVDVWPTDERPSIALPSDLAELAAKPPGQGLTIRASYPHRPEGIPGTVRAVLVPWEVSLLPAGLAEALNANVDRVLAPSRFCEEVLRSSGVPPAKITYFPHGVDRSRFNPQVRPVDLRRMAQAGLYTRPDLTLDLGSLAVLLHLGSGILRKGTDLLIGAYFDEFTGRDPVLLVIKSSGGDTRASGWIENALRTAEDPPRILYISDDTPPPLLPSYYTACDCLVHPCRGEGFGLPVLEAMACGRPAIVTNWSGPRDFCDEQNAYLLDYQLVGCQEFNIPVPPEAVWAAPDRNHLRELMRRVVTAPEEARAKGRRAAADAARWDWEHSAYRLLEELGLLASSEG